MTAPLKAIDGNADLPALMTELAHRARAAARVLALASPEQKNRALDAIARAIRANVPAILGANAEDVAEVRSSGATSAFIDRLTLTPARIEAMADGVATVREIADPIGAVTESWQRPNGMIIERVRVPLGVIAVIFESRPNVAADAGVLCLKSGNAVILRGGSDSFRSCRAIHDCLVQGVREAGLPEAAITLVPTRDRAAVGLLLTGLNGGVDVIVPRGGKSLVARVEAEARVPVFAHLEGVNHVYVDRTARLDMAKSIVLNAKMRRTGVCGAAETLLVDRAGAAHAGEGRCPARGQGRVCPSPRMRYLKVVSCSTPTGPRACMRPVAMPISAPKPNSPPSANCVEALCSTIAESTSRRNLSATFWSAVTIASVWCEP